MVDVDALRLAAGRPLRERRNRRHRGEQKTSSIDLAHGMRNVFFTYSMLARVSATMSLVGDAVSSTYQPR